MRVGTHFGPHDHPFPQHLTAAGGTSTFRLNFTTPANAPLRKKYLITGVNGNELIVESSHGNRCLTGVENQIIDNPL